MLRAKKMIDKMLCPAMRCHGGRGCGLLTLMLTRSSGSWVFVLFYFVLITITSHRGMASRVSSWFVLLWSCQPWPRLERLWGYWWCWCWNLEGWLSGWVSASRFRRRDQASFPQPGCESKALPPHSHTQLWSAETYLPTPRNDPSWHEQSFKHRPLFLAVE